MTTGNESGPPLSAGGQVRALVALRWAMVRRTRVRLGLGLLAAAVPAALVATVAATVATPPAGAGGLSLLVPSAFLGFGALTVAAPLSIGGGNELLPPDQLVAYPVRPGAVYLGSLVVAPLNLAWVSQLLVLTYLTAYLGPHDLRLGAALLTTALFVLATTALGQLLAWGIVGLRQQRWGRLALWGALGALVATITTVIQTGNSFPVLDALPTRRVAVAIAALRRNEWALWGERTAALGALGALVLLAGGPVCNWALRRPADAGAARDARVLRRRAPRRSLLRELTALDRAAVWRTPSLRRGALLISALPAAAALGIGVSWTSLAVLPGLVAAGAGLLFAVNAFCLDASGGVWLASLPHDPALQLRSKLVVAAQVCGLAVAVPILTALLRAGSPPRASAALAVACSALACVGWVVATSLRLSVTRPHRADLRGPRDAPAPPATMAVYSVRLAVATTTLGLVFSAAGQARQPLVPVLLLIPVAVRVLLSVRGTQRRWADAAARARVVLTVASG